MKKYFLFLLFAVFMWMGGIVGFNVVNAEEEIIADDKIPDLYIKAVNPGYTVNGKSNVGEMIEIARKDSDTPFSLAGIAVGYTDTNGEQILFSFPENSFLTGETLLLRLASSPNSELAAVTYKVSGTSSGLKQSAGPLVLRRGDTVIDSVCWTGDEGCYRKFKSGSGETLIRNLETGEFDYTTDYEPDYDVKSYYVEQVIDDGLGEVSGPSQCKGLEFSELLSYYDVTKSEQFIEFYNRKSEQILLNGCILKYKNKKYVLSGIVKPEEYYVYYPNENGFSITKNPTNSNTLELIDSNGRVLDKLIYPNGQRKGTSYAFIGYDSKGDEIWRVTYAPTPGTGNVFQEYKTCEKGKVINQETGNCVKVADVKTRVCKEGQYLNPLTGRCRKIQTTEEKKCKEGYYLNPETNRCRKIKNNNGADYSVEPEEYEENSSFVALYAVIGVLGVGVGYLIWEYRSEIKRLFGKVFR